MTSNEHNKSISLICLILFSLIVGTLILSGGWVGFLLAPMACDSPSSCKGALSHFAVYLLMLFPIELILSLIVGWFCYFFKRYNQSMWLTWGVSVAWLGFVFLNL